MTKPLRKIPWCRHYAHMAIIMLSAAVFAFFCLYSAANQQTNDVPKMLSIALGRFLPFLGSLLFLIILFEQMYTRFKPQWKRNVWYYHISVPALYLLAALFLEKSDLLQGDNNFGNSATVTYFFLAVPILLYLYRVFIPFAFVKKIKYAITGDK